MKDIAESANVGKGTIYRHFGNKKELFGSLIERATVELINNLKNISTENCSLKKQLIEILQVHFNFFENKRSLVHIIVREGLEQTGDEFGYVLDRWNQYRDTVVDIFETVTPKSEVPMKSSPEPSFAAELFLSWIWGVLRDRVVFDRNPDLDTSKEIMAELFIRGWSKDET